MIIWVYITLNRHSDALSAGQLTSEAPIYVEPIGAAGTEASIFVIPTRIEEIEDTRYLELINHDYSIGREPDSHLIVPAWPVVPVRARDITLHETALNAVNDLFNAARVADAGSFFISSGYRSHAVQKQLYDDAADKAYVAQPNHSEHQAGLAADIFAAEVSQSNMAASGEGIWLARHSWEHGLILRYTEDKRGITQIPGEPWHFRYIGQPHAWYSYRHDLCMEEYIQFLKDYGRYDASFDGKEYSVLYQMPENGIIYVPENRQFNVSGDNTGGYIVTAWR